MERKRRNALAELIANLRESANGESYHRQIGPCGPPEEGCKSCYGKWTWKKAPIWFLMLQEARVQFRMWVWRDILRCKHPNWVCEDWAGPDSGGMGGYCPRCGFGFRETLY